MIRNDDTAIDEEVNVAQKSLVRTAAWGIGMGNTLQAFM